MAVIIFDFDGTIANSFDYVSQFLAGQKGIKNLTIEQKNDLRNCSMAAMLKKLGFHWWDAPRLFFRGRMQMTRTIKSLQPFQDMPEVIRKLHAEGHELFVLSHNSVSNIHIFLHNQKLHTYFLEIYGGASIFGKSSTIKRLLKENNLETKDAVYIGDEQRDIVDAQSVNMRVIGVTWGFAELQSLIDQKPTALAYKPEDIISILEEL